MKEEIIEQIYKVADILSKERVQARDYGTGQPLFHSEVHLIMAIMEHPNAKASELADDLGITNDAVSQVADKLESKKFIERFQLNDNKKDIYFRLTDKGTKTYYGHISHHEKMNAKVIEYIHALSKKDYKVIADFVDMLVRGVLMDNNEEILGNAPVRKAVAHMVIPAIIASLVLIIYNIADTFFIGKTGDPSQVAAVSFANAIFILFMAIANLIGIGGSVFISILFGRGEKERAKLVSSFCCWVSLGLGILLGALIIIFINPIVSFLGASGESFAFTKDYLFYIALGTPFILFATVFGHIVRGEGAAKISMIGGIIGTVVNIILDPLLILTFHMNTAGAAIATVAGNLVGCAFYLIYFWSKKSNLSLHPKHLKYWKANIKEVLSLGLPAGANAALSGVAMLLLIKVLASYGDNTVAAMGIVTKANMLIEFVQQGIANGILALLGYNYGIGNMPRFKKILRFSFFLTCGIGIVLSAVYIFSGGALIQLFINDTSVIEKGISMSVVLAISGVTYGILFVCVSAMQALERPLPATIISLCRQGIFFIPLLFIFNTIFGFYGAISVQTVTNYLSAIIAIFLLRYCFKKANTKPVLQVKKE